MNTALVTSRSWSFGKLVPSTRGDKDDEGGQAVFTSQGIATDSWVLISGDCELSCEVVGDQAQFEFGHGTSSLHLNASEGGS